MKEFRLDPYPAVSARYIFGKSGEQYDQKCAEAEPLNQPENIKYVNIR